MLNNLFWIIFESLSSIYNAFIILYFCTKFCGCSKSKFDKGTAFSITFLIFSATILTFDHITYFDGLAVFIYIAIAFIYSLLILDGSIFKKFFASVIPLACVTIICALVVNSMSIIINIPAKDLLSERSVFRIEAIIIGQLAITYVIFLLLSLTKKNKYSLNLSEWALLGSVFIVSIIVFWFLYMISLNISTKDIKIWILSASLGLIVINIVTYYLLIRLSRSHAQLLNYSLINQQYELQAEAAENLKIQYEELRKIKHDFHNHLNVIQILNSENKQKEITEYIDKYSNLSKQNAGYLSTDNNFINALLSSKAIKAKENNIELTISATQHLGGIDDIDFCGLIGNLIDNAIEGCIKCKNTKQINLNICCTDGIVKIFIKNSIEQSVLAQNPKLKTSKKDKNSHGLGTKIIKDIIKKYNGLIDYYEEDSMFCCNTILYY